MRHALKIFGIVFLATIVASAGTIVPTTGQFFENSSNQSSQYSWDNWSNSCLFGGYSGSCQGSYAYGNGSHYQSSYFGTNWVDYTLSYQSASISSGRGNGTNYAYWGPGYGGGGNQFEYSFRNINEYSGYSIQGPLFYEWGGRNGSRSFGNGWSNSFYYEKPEGFVEGGQYSFVNTLLQFDGGWYREYLLGELINQSAWNWESLETNKVSGSWLNFYPNGGGSGGGGSDAPVPEPSSYALMGTGLVGLSMLARQRKK